MAPLAAPLPPPLNKDAAGNSQTFIQFSHIKEDLKFIKPDKEMKN